MFLEHQIIQSERFLKDYATLQDWSNSEKVSFDHRNKLQFKLYSHRK